MSSSPPTLLHKAALVSIIGGFHVARWRETFSVLTTFVLLMSGMVATPNYPPLSHRTATPMGFVFCLIFFSLQPLPLPPATAEYLPYSYPLVAGVSRPGLWFCRLLSLFMS